METLFITARSNASVLPILRKNWDCLKNFEKVGLLATVQHLQTLPELKKFIEKEGKTAVIGGQVLGCNFEAAKSIEGEVNCFLLVSSGKFHGLGLAQATEKPVLVLDSCTNQIDEVSRQDIDRLERKKIARIEKAKSMQVYGIVVSVKKGQDRFEEALRLKKQLKTMGKETYIFLSDLIQPAEVLNFPQIECWINTACPRIVEDDWEKLVINKEDINWLNNVK